MDILPFNIKAIFLLISALLNTIVVLLLAFRSRWHFPEKVFGICVMGVALWAFNHFILEIGKGLTSGMLILSYIVTPVIAGSFFVFINSLPDRKLQENKKLIFWTSALLLLTLVFVLLPGAVIEKFIYDENSRLTRISFGPLYWPVFGLFIIGAFGAALAVLLRKIRQASAIFKIQLWYIFWGTSVSVVLGVITNLILPYFNQLFLYWFGPAATVIFSIFTVYAIFRHHLMNIRVIGTEFFAAAISIIFIVQIFFSQSAAEIFARTFLFVLVVIFGLFLIRGTLREVETLRRLSEAKTEFISIASHQLRSPLTAIKGYVSMLLEGSFDGSKDESRRVLEKVYKSNERLIRLIDELLDISRIEEGRFEFSMTPTSIIPFLADIVDELQGAVDKTRISLVFQTPQNKEYMVEADPEKFRQVFQNLIDNAIRYTPQGEIKVLCELRGKNVLIGVRDTGIGMSKEDIARIFERFSRGKSSQQHHAEGAGLGLYIASKIVAAHKGKIWAESPGHGQGSTFYVELPLKV